MGRSPESFLRSPLFGALLFGVTCVCAGVGWRMWGGDAGLLVSLPAAAPPAPASPAPEPAPPARPGDSAPLLPSFDIVRVSPDGGIVLAGQAEPGSIVTVKEGERLIGEAEADVRGAWVAVPTTRLPPGAGELTLTARGKDGQVRSAAASALIVVPSRPGAETAGPAAPPLALLSTPAAPSRLLQAPPGGSLGKLALGTVDYDDNGAIRFSGTAPAGASVRVYVDNHPAGDATADSTGRWLLSPTGSVAAGLHRLRVDQLSARGQVAARVELPFSRETSALARVAPGQVVVEPGQNLWRLARGVYGTGQRYTVIYAANRDQIRDAARIYPGQVFNTPGMSQ